MSCVKWRQFSKASTGQPCIIYIMATDVNINNNVDPACFSFFAVAVWNSNLWNASPSDGFNNSVILKLIRNNEFHQAIIEYLINCRFLRMVSDVFFQRHILGIYISNCTPKFLWYLLLTQHSWYIEISDMLHLLIVFNGTYIHNCLKSVLPVLLSIKLHMIMTAECRQFLFRPRCLKFMF